MADLNVASVLFLGVRMGAADVSNAPNAKAWIERCTSRPAAQRVFSRR